VVALAARLGIEAELRSEPSLALGTSEVSLLDLTGAYGAFATGGVAVEPHIVRRIRSSTGRVLYARPSPPSDPIASPSSVAALNDMLQTVVRSGTGRRAEIAGHSTAGKTGTSQDFRDAWFVGYTAHFVGGVWVGNDNGEPMRRVTGGNLPAQIWNKVMAGAHQGRESLPLQGTGGAGTTGDRLANDDDSAPPPELLPWQMPTRMPPAMTKPVTPVPDKRADPGRYPTDRIDDDFIGRALSEIPLRPSPALQGLMSVSAGPR
jgi:penicillin-binding protein 1A